MPQLSRTVGDFFLKGVARSMQGYKTKALILDQEGIRRALVRIAHEIIESNKGTENLALVGIVNRGDILAGMLAKQIKEIEGVDVPVGTLDITFYRDDFSTNIAPVIQATHLPFCVDNKRIVLVDDILFTGRTIRSALNALIDFGRPARIQLAVIIDRGHRELPIRADFVGKNIPSAKHERLALSLEPLDDYTAVEILERIQGEE